ncbi:putative cytotoxic protein [Rhodococcus sp. AG1013]|uniref:colicin E3/pyocin S6 family cytotoxin n=1 Tax=Rhodococcus sp. AG1013 TaxID=2183996 RepID=UPI000E2B0182|nr:colicin E3/pyocin S6 family cytotoxin [Rhodococcus sp. AG1013]RDI26784.1 putative cytotoxic protein [Rhodococcus sp. AG1013]
MAPITMDASLLADAAELYGTAQASGQEVAITLAAVLDANWGCAGSDSAGATWAASYDPAAFDAIAAGTDIVNAFGKMHDLLAFTALNHENVEKANKNPPEPPDGPPPQLPSSTSPTFKGAFGGDTDEPFGWGLVSSWLQGHTWPNGDPDKLRALGDAWRAAAKGLRSAGDETGSAFPLLEDIVSGEIPQALAQMDLVFTDTEQVAAQYESLASSCEDWADKIEDAHHKILAILAGALGAGLIIGGVAGFFTAGTGAAAAAGAAGSAAGASIVTVLITFDAAAAAAVGATVAAGVAIGGVATDLQPLLEANPTTFNSTTTSGGGGGAHNYVTPPKNLSGFPNARPAKRLGHRKRWQDDKGNTYEWDYQHGAIEKYDKNGKHQGEYNPDTGAQTKPADPKRRPER